MKRKKKIERIMTHQELSVLTKRPVKRILYENESIVIFQQSDYSLDYFFNKKSHNFFKNSGKGICGVFKSTSWNKLPMWQKN